MPVTDAEVREALRPVQDPELHQSIVDLEMVGDVRIDGGTVGVTVTLTVAGCPLRAELTDRVTAAVSALDGVDRVDVAFDVMSDEQRAALRQRLQGQSGQVQGQPAGGHGHGQVAHRGKVPH